MILELSKNSETMSSGALRKGHMDVDDSAKGKAKIMMMFSEGLYKDGVGSVIREWTSNALDSHVEAKVEEPVIVTLEKERFGVYWLRVQDFGVGISPERQEKVVEKYLGTTKDQSPDLLGAYGLGLKSALAYSDSFTYVTRYNGIEYTYIMYKGEEGTEIDLVREVPTTERNGSTFNLKIKNEEDYNEFINKAKVQLCYFEKVYFNCPSISNDFKIIKDVDWKYSTLNNDPYMHLCLDNVYYPLDWNKLEIAPIQFNIGLNFSISDGIHPLPAREDIQYKPSVIEMIKQKIAKVADFFVNRYNDSITEKKDYLEARPYINAEKLVLIGGQIRKPIWNLAKSHSSLPIKEVSIKGITLLNLKDIASKEGYWFNEYVVKQKVYYGKYTTKIGYGSNLEFFRNEADPSYVLLNGAPPKGVKLLFIKDQMKHVNFITKTHDKRLGSIRYGRGGLGTYAHICSLGNQPKSTWRAIIKEFQSILESIVGKVKKYDDIKVTDEWLKARKESRAEVVRTSVSKEEINPKWGYSGNRTLMSFISRGTQLISTLHREKGLVIYGSEDQKQRLNQFKHIKVSVAVLSDRDMKKMEKYKIHNWIKIEQFMEGKNNIFKKTVTSSVVKKLIENNREAFRVIDDIKKLSTPLGESMNELKDYRRESSYIDDDLMAEMQLIAEENNLFDIKIMDKVKEVSEKLAKFDFLPAFKLGSYDSLTPLQFKLAIEILKGRKFKLDLAHYTKDTVVLSAEEDLELEIEETKVESDESEEEVEEDELSDQVII
jgi:hypothetical protein